MKHSCLSYSLLAAWLHFGTAWSSELSFVTEHFPPFSYEVSATKQGTGPMTEVVTAVCNKIRAQCTIQAYPWRRAMLMAKSGEVDGIFSFLRTPEREQSFFFSENIVESAYSFFAPTPSTFHYKKPQDLEGYTVAVYGIASGTGIALQDLLTPVANVTITTDIKNSTVLKKLAAGRYGNSEKTIAAMNRDVGLHLIKVEGIKGIKVVGDYQKISYGIGFSKTRVSEAQFKEFNDALKDLIKEGRVSAILGEYGLKPAL